MRYLAILVASTALVACGAIWPSGGQAEPSPPPAVQALIHDLESQPPANPPAYVASYDYHGQVVYYVPPRCCDIFSDLYDAGGQLICHPDGGLAGKGDERCPDFAVQRTHERIIWRDTRSRG